jgi:amino acid transporter
VRPLCVGISNVSTQYNSHSTTSHKVGAAAVARSLSGYIQELADISKYVPTNADYIAVSAVIILCICMAFGVQTSTNLNSLFTLTNLVVIAFVVVYGAVLAEPHNWCRRIRSAKIIRFLGYL